jgi:hypothetical protein
MDFEKIQEEVGKLEKLAEGFGTTAEAPSLRKFAVGLRDLLQTFLKDRRQPIRPGQICKDAAEKNIIPGDIAPRADGLILRWGGAVTPQMAQVVKDDGARFATVAAKILPVLKAYCKDVSPP